MEDTASSLRQPVANQATQSMVAEPNDHLTATRALSKARKRDQLWRKRRNEKDRDRKKRKCQYPSDSNTHTFTLRRLQGQNARRQKVRLPLLEPILQGIQRAWLCKAVMDWSRTLIRMSTWRKMSPCLCLTGILSRYVTPLRDCRALHAVFLSANTLKAFGPGDNAFRWPQARSYFR